MTKEKWKFWVVRDFFRFGFSYYFVIIFTCCEVVFAGYILLVIAELSRYSFRREFDRGLG